VTAATLLGSGLVRDDLVLLGLRLVTGIGRPACLACRHDDAPSRSAPRLSPDGTVFLFTSSRPIGNEPLDHPLSYDELETRLHRPGNGLRDIYAVDASVLRLAITAPAAR
jgi:hypothetical protein